ncbi:MAG: glycosyl transferase family 2 [Oceanidesulfovibrio sp.]
MGHDPAFPHPFFEYSRAVLDFRLGKSCRSFAVRDFRAEEDVAAAAERAVRMLQRTGRPRVLLLGLGDGRLARTLAAPGALPPGVELTVCDADPELVRELVASGQTAGDVPFLPDWITPRGNRQLLVDASPHALFLLLALAGYGPDGSVILQNPSAPVSTEIQNVRRLLANASRVDIPEHVLQPPPSLASILHPEEPALDQFFAQAPSWARQWVVVWDAKDVPETARRLAREHCPVPVTHLARTLHGDFAAQRNACLAAVNGDHVLFLDGDERLTPEGWALIPRLADMDVAGWLFPRRTLYPEASRCKIGYGLWPDLQLRLFRIGPGVAFERPVHERVVGLSGATGIAPAASILHHSRLLKDPQQLARKLQTFDNAGHGAVRHRLAAEYPSCDCALLDAAAASWHGASLVLSLDHA